MSFPPDNELVNEVIFHFLLSAFCSCRIGRGIKVINVLNVTVKELFDEIILMNV